MTRNANDDEFPALPPLSSPPATKPDHEPPVFQTELTSSKLVLPVPFSQQPVANDHAAVADVERPSGAERDVAHAAPDAAPQPPEKPVRVRTGSNIMAPAGLPSIDALRVTFAEEVILNNKFRLLKQLSVQDDEIIYEALHTGTGRRVQLHVLPSGLSADSPAAQKMLRAARAAGRVPHTSVLSVVDSATDEEGRPFLVYEHFSAPACSEIVASRGPFEAKRAGEIMLLLLDALSAMHARGLVHRHVRPENVLIDEVGSLRVKLTGFTYAVISGKAAQVPDLPKGYSRYLAPEARRGISSTADSIDIYAAGVLMRYLLTGDTDPSAPLEFRAQKAIERATADDPDDRFQSASQFHSAVMLLFPEGDRPVDSQAPRDALTADLKYMQERREREASVTPAPIGAGRLELLPVLMFIEAIYGQLGAAGWQRVLAAVPECEQLLPAAGKASQNKRQGVPVDLVTRMLSAADRVGGRGDTSWLPHVGEAIVKRGVSKFCPNLPKQMSPAVLVDCVGVLWSSLSRQGEVVILERFSNQARVAIRGQTDPSLEISAVMAGLLRAMLRQLSEDAELSTVSSQALGDAADVFVLSWG